MERLWKYFVKHKTFEYMHKSYDNEVGMIEACSMAYDITFRFYPDHMEYGSDYPINDEQMAYIRYIRRKYNNNKKEN